MATKSYSKHKEFKEFSTKSTTPYSDEQFDMIKSELLPKNSKLGSLGRGGGGGASGSDNEYHYEYHEDRHPSGKYERKDLHTVEQYTTPAKPSGEHSSYYYTREDTALPAITSSAYSHLDTTGSSTPGYSKIRSKTTKDLAQNVDELDSLLDDLQRDQERQLYKGGYTSDTAESSSFDYRKTSGTPAKLSTAPSSGYSTLKTAERVENSSWTTSPLAPPPPIITRDSELTREVYREEKTESRMVPSQVSPALPQLVPAVVCSECHHHPGGTLTRSGAPMNKVTTTVKTYTYEVPADQDPTSLPIPVQSQHQTLSEQRYLHSDTTRSAAIPPSPSLGCQYCSHCNSRITTKEYNTVSSQRLAPPPPATTLLSTTEHRYESTNQTDGPASERVVYPSPANETRTPANYTDRPPANGHGPNGPSTYKWSETSYSAYNATERHPVNGGPAHLTGAPAPFPRPLTPSPGTQQPPKQLDQLLAEFPDATYPSQPDGLRGRKVEVYQESSSTKKRDAELLPPRAPPAGASKNVSGPAVYYPPGHEPFANKEGAYQAASAAQAQGGGAYAAGRGMYEYESGAKSKEKTTERKAVVPVCLPLCCAMPCSIM